MNISFSDKLPTEPGSYIALFDTFGMEIVDIYYQETYYNAGVQFGGELFAKGKRTHFSRWKCLWSEKITPIKENYEKDNIKS
jgi:hypothetical protein